jgi:hypothetical protein
MNRILLCPSIIALAVVPLWGPARAYSDEAVADAERLVEVTVERAKAGEASAQDLAVVRYNLLEMKLGAGKISQRSFCLEAHGGLLAMAKAAGDEETKAGIEELGEKIAEMTTTPELCRQASAAVDAFLFSDRLAEPSNAEADDAQRAAREAERRYKAGEINRTDAARAAATSLEAQYAAGKLAREDYCRSGQAETLANLARWVDDEAKVGQAGLLEQVDASRRLFRFKALCHKPA